MTRILDFEKFMNERILIINEEGKIEEITGEKITATMGDD